MTVKHSIHPPEPTSAEILLKDKDPVDLLLLDIELARDTTLARLLSRASFHCYNLVANITFH